MYRQKKEIITANLEKEKYPYYVNGIITEYDNKTVDKKDIEKYNYLVKIPLYNFTEEKIKELEEKINKLKEEYDILYNKTVNNLWSEELSILEKEYKKYIKS